jgi:hypothetical protein
VHRSALLVALLLLGCEPERDRSGSPPGPRRDAGPRDATPSDSAILDGASLDGAADGSILDGSTIDIGFSDGGFADGGGFFDAAPPADAGPSRSGLEEFCDRYFVCGGTYYANAADCVNQSVAFWGNCTQRRAALDAFSTCMAAIPCADYNPNAYNPASTPCASLWAALQSTPGC